MSVESAFTQPILHPDGTLGCVLLEKTGMGVAGMRLDLVAPTPPPPHLAGRYYLARCTEDTPEARQTHWSIYGRRPLFAAGPPTPNGSNHLSLHLPHSSDPGYLWLARRPIGTRINLIGPLGQAIELPASARTLLIATTEALLPLTLPAIHAMLDRGGRVAVYLDAPQTGPSRPLLPLAVELHPFPDRARWEAELQTILRWADHVIAALDLDRYAILAQAIRAARFRLEPGFAHLLAAPALLCGYGACLACVVPTADGSLTRACVHGPFFPLEQLVR